MTNRIGDNLVHFGGNKELVAALVQQGVRFVVIGGIAVAWHRTTRTADDMDLLVDPTAENSHRIATALASLNLRGFSPDSFVKPGLQIPLKQQHYAELLTPKDQSHEYAKIEAGAVDGKLFGIPVRIAGVEDLISMKKQALQSANEQAAKHQSDIDLLQPNGA